jgi:hypothetical protein
VFRVALIHPADQRADDTDVRGFFRKITAAGATRGEGCRSRGDFVSAVPWVPLGWVLDRSPRVCVCAKETGISYTSGHCQALHDMSGLNLDD